MNECEYPFYYSVANKIAANNKAYYFRLHFVELLFLVGIPLYMALNLFLKEYWDVDINSNWIPSFLSVLVLAFRFVLNFGSFDKKWSHARTFVESLKKESWNYMMKVGVLSGPASQVDPEFIMVQERLLEAAGQATDYIKQGDIGGQTITQKMTDIRKKPWKSRLAIYKEGRLRDQIQFYTKKCKSACKWESGIKWKVFFLELAVFGIFILDSNYTLYIGLVVPIIMALTGWSQLKKYRQISLSYGAVAKNLHDKECLSRHIGNESAFADFVEDCENYISTENSSWAILME